jgi:hypothetical protein
VAKEPNLFGFLNKVVQNRDKSKNAVLKASSRAQSFAVRMEMRNFAPTIQ